MWIRAFAATLLLLAADAAAAQPELGLVLGRSTESGETDVARLVYRHRLPAAAWWSPSQLQLGAGIWRVPDLRGRTRRFDLSAVRKESVWPSCASARRSRSR